MLSSSELLFIMEVICSLKNHLILRTNSVAAFKENNSRKFYTSNETFAVKVLVFYICKCTHTFDEFSRFLPNLSSKVSSWFLLLQLSYTKEFEKVKKKERKFKRFHTVESN